MRQVEGVGAATSLAYVLTLENPQWFVKSREPRGGSVSGLRPKQEDSWRVSRTFWDRSDRTPACVATDCDFGIMVGRMQKRVVVGSPLCDQGVFDP